MVAQALENPSYVGAAAAKLESQWGQGTPTGDQARLIGDVRLQPGVQIASTVLIRADEGLPFWVGAGATIQDGVMIHGLAQGQVMGDDQQSYSVWIGRDAAIACKALIHGPVYIGDRCIVGFRSTIFNARLGAGSIVMFHALVQDVEIPPGKYVPSGAVITQQEQVDQLSDVQPDDIAFAMQVAGLDSAASTASHFSAPVRAVPVRSVQSASISSQSNGANGVDQVLSQSSLTSEVLSQVSQLTRQGYQIGIEHADSRRYRSNAWSSGGLIEARNESQVVAALEQALSQYSGEYVRLIGIDPQVKRRVLELTIQRPDGSVPDSAKSAPVTSFNTGGSANGWSASVSSSALEPAVVQQVGQLLNQGYKIGTEHADARRFRMNAWQSCAPIQSTNPSEVVRALEACLAEHQDDYVRLIGIDAPVKRRVLEMTIQRPGGGAATVTTSNGSLGKAAAVNSAVARNVAVNGNGAATASVGGDVAQHVRQLLNQGHRIGLEYADQRHYRANAWKTCSVPESGYEGDVLKAVKDCLAAHAGEYVRLIGIDKAVRRRVLEITIQRP